jgi:hypothetical protein
MFDDLPLDPEQAPENDSLFAVCFFHENKSAWLYHSCKVDPMEDELTSSMTKAWNLVKKLPGEVHKIKKGDTIKFGRVRFKVVRFKVGICVDDSGGSNANQS